MGWLGTGARCSPRRATGGRDRDVRTERDETILDAPDELIRELGNPVAARGVRDWIRRVERLVVRGEDDRPAELWASEADDAAHQERVFGETFGCDFA